MPSSKKVSQVLAACVIVGFCSCLRGQGLGRSEPPYVEATATMPTKLINNPEKRADLVADLADKSEMNYRLLALKLAEKWQSSVRNDKEFLKNIRKCKTVSFTVHEDGTIAIKGVEDPPKGKAKSKPKSGGTKDTASSSPAPPKDSASGSPAPAKDSAH